MPLAYQREGDPAIYYYHGVDAERRNNVFTKDRVDGVRILFPRGSVNWIAVRNFVFVPDPADPILDTEV